MAVELDPRLLEVLACPCSEHAPLRPGRGADQDADFLTCTACGAAFPVRDGIPVLLWDEAVDVRERSGGADVEAGHAEER